MATAAVATGCMLLCAIHYKPKDIRDYFIKTSTINGYLLYKVLTTFQHINSLKLQITFKDALTTLWYRIDAEISAKGVWLFRHIYFV